MRITQQFLFNGLLKELSRNREMLAEFQDQLSTGKRVTKASDDGVAFGISRSLENVLRKNEQFKSNISTGLSQARSTQQSLQDMVDIMIDLQKVAVNGSTDTLAEDDRLSLADEVASFRDQMIDLANSKYNNTYLFAGTNSDTVPFTPDGTATGGVADSSTSQPLKIQLSSHATIETSITGSDLRDTDAGDLFEVFESVENALRNDDTTALKNTMGDIETATDHIIGLTSGIGSNINRMQFVTNQIESQSINQEAEISQLTDTDYAEAISNFQKHETTYNAALNVHARITQTSLLNYI
ncbi:flagellar hook-associated protein FlgL [Fodinibius sediminis]|uniref:Flagellar hook-associated protein 3 FlgL n=1 Tax=Fodinibius sediminis TaxID=1214077 RepID=A0A521CJ02_9BACT|nr:flagellar hook-associated protein FlgL [Fodinibius sediminis]SMO58731.1 flagellar hook-associated protein 3 FlgL [Fodinibius sediminis]